jgi:hypothetical protein
MKEVENSVEHELWARQRGDRSGVQIEDGPSGDSWFALPLLQRSPGTGEVNHSVAPRIGERALRNVVSKPDSPSYIGKGTLRSRLPDVHRNLAGTNGNRASGWDGTHWSDSTIISS